MPHGSDDRAEPKGRPAESPPAPAGRPILAANARHAARCLEYVLRHFGLCARRRSLERDLTTDTPGGEATNLLAVVARHGLRARPRVVGQEAWEDLPVASLLQLGPSDLVVYMGRVGGDALVYDPSGGHRRVACDELERLFTGVVVEFVRAADAGRA